MAGRDVREAVVIGGGIAGVSVAAELAEQLDGGRVALVEMEDQLAVHTTGRSAAMFLSSYGGPVVRALTSASRAFMEDGGLLAPRGLLWIAPPEQLDALHDLHADVRELVPSIRLLTPDEAMEVCPILRRDRLAGALHEPDAMEIDVHALHSGYVRRLRAAGGEVVPSFPVAHMQRRDGAWDVTDPTGRTVRARIVVDAAGAWCDEVARLAGARPLGIAPLRRTLFTVAAPPEHGDLDALPLVSDVAHTFYVKPEGGQLLCSPADETPMDPCDARPGEVEIAQALDRIREATVLDPRHVRASWAGLRSFVADRVPVAGWDDEVEGFFWMAGQGGYGIQLAPALARVAAALLLRRPIPDDVDALGVTADDLHRSRLGRG